MPMICRHTDVTPKIAGAGDRALSAAAGGCVMDIYTERAHLVAVLGRIYPSHLFMPSDAEPGYVWAICIHFPWGQGTWHLADDDARTLFHDFLILDSDWDGHTSEQKYEAMRRFIRQGQP
jgi:hypothetical protein